MTRPAYDPAKTYRFKSTAFPFEAETELPDSAGVTTLLTEVAKIPRKGYSVTGENVTPAGSYLGETEIVAYTEVEATP